MPKRDRYGRLILDSAPSNTLPDPSTSVATTSATSTNPPKKLTRLEKRILEVTGGTDGYKALQDRIHEMSSRVVDRASPSARQHYSNTKRAFETCVTLLARIIMKDIHDAIAARRAEAKKDQPAEKEGMDVDEQERIRLEHLRYFSSLQLGDLFQLADYFNVPREEVEPYAERMLSIFHFPGKTLLK